MTQVNLADRWIPAHAALCVLAGAGAVGAGRPALLSLVGAASLVAFFVLGRPAQRRLGGVGVANAVTLARLGVLALAPLALPAGPALALGLSVVLLLDGVDGAVARRLGEASDFGARFDLETDALFVAVLSVAAVGAGAPPWVLLFGLLRSALVLARLAFPAEARRERRSRFGRLVFVGAVGALLLSLLELPAAVETPVLAAALAALLASFSQDFLVLRRA